MIRHWFCCIVLFFNAILTLTISAQNAEAAENSTEATSSIEEEHMTFSIFSENESFTTGQPFWLAIQMDLDETWHTYWKNPGDCGMPLELDWNLPEGFTLLALEWPIPTEFKKDDMIGYGYKNQATFLAQIAPPSTPWTDAASIEVNINWLTCSDLFCFPGETLLKLELPFSPENPTINPSASAIFEKARAALPKKHPIASIHRNENFIELSITLDSPPSVSFKKASFLPESQKMIDERFEAIVKVSNQPERYTIILKQAENNPINSLAGILLLEEEEGKSEAIAIDLVVPPMLGETTFAFVDTPLPNSLAISLSPIMANEETQFEGGMILAFFLAFLGGLMLNCMPCVLPVISFKILSFIKMAGQDRKTTFHHGIAFSAGVLISFWAFASVLLLLQSYGHSLGWGFQLQEPRFVAFLAALLLIFALSMFGVFELGTSLTSLAGQAQETARGRSSGLFGSFCSGILATALATPCTGPFFGPVVGFAFTLPSIAALAIFTFLGLGMAFPYLILTAFPSLLSFLPKPGNWMITFKELMGFAMLTTVLWLGWVFSGQTGDSALVMLLFALLLISFGFWVYGRFCSPVSGKGSQIFGALFTAACVFLASAVIIFATPPQESIRDGDIAFSDSSKTSLGWEPFSHDRLAELQSKGTPVFIDFTAHWCLTCQVNHGILSLPSVRDELQQHHVVKMKADLTNKDPIVLEALRKFGRSSVPLYVLYGTDPSKPPQILPQMLTPNIVIEALNHL